MSKETFKTQYGSGHMGDDISLENKLRNLAGFCYDAINPPVEIVTDDKTLTAEDTGKVFLIGTDGLAITLPSTAAGLRYTFINSGAAGDNIVTVSPAAADGISGTITLAGTVVVDAGVVDKDVINTKATSEAGDSITLIGTGVAGTTAWIIEKSTGIWAAEA